MRKRYLLFTCVLLAAMLIVGACGQKSTEKKEIPLSENKTINEGFPLTIEDALGNTVTLAKKPEKVAVISGQLIDLFCSLGGSTICSVTLDELTAAKDTAGQLPVIGSTSAPDLVKIIDLQPDLVIAEFGLQNDMVFMLQQSNIPVIALNLEGEENKKKTVKILKEVAGIKS
ncbi:ABC transporter substrate-binding protein [Phosphitispora sp. TUW77]|uniref:ABC transporter substrate-binding protein n=1 Tax=Phosphitispora sp. TUW77 TaxID=3152361 RepID=UPI003AB29BE6